MKKKIYFYVAIDILLWLVNTLVLLFNHQRIRLNLLSALALIPILMMVLQAIQSYQYRHCENILKEPPLRGTLRYRAKTHKSEQTYSDEYMDEFSWMLASVAVSGNIVTEKAPCGKLNQAFGRMFAGRWQISEG